MENRGLIFIPDISGFTRFISETEIEHSRLIIQELLEILINSNQVGLEVSEVEGDAILFYKFGDPPPLEELYKQVEKMFCEFHRSLAAYELRRYCQCKACMGAIGLTLKVISHYGEYTIYNVKNFHKLIGKDIIVAHQLLKNEIPQHEYWLVTDSLLRDKVPAGYKDWMEWDSSVKKTETGEIPFHYTKLTALRNSLPAEAPEKPDFSNKAKVVSSSREYEAGIIELFHASGDFHYRSRWRESIVEVEELTHYLPRVGMRCRNILKNGESVTFSSSYSFHPERIEFGETEEGSNNITYYTLEKTGTDKTRLTFDYYIANNFFDRLRFNLFNKKEMETNFNKSLHNLSAVVKEIKLPPLEL